MTAPNWERSLDPDMREHGCLSYRLGHCFTLAQLELYKTKSRTGFPLAQDRGYGSGQRAPSSMRTRRLYPGADEEGHGVGFSQDVYNQ